MASATRSGRRRLFDYVPGQHRARPVRNGIIFLAIIGAGLYMGYTRSVPFLPKSGALYKAEFDTVDYIRPNTPVRVAGIQVGEVENLERSEDGSSAVMTFRMTDPTVKIKRDASATLLWRTLLGFNYEMTLDPGSAGSPELQAGDTIPLANNESQTSFDEVFEPLDEFGRGAVRGFIKEFDEGFAGEGAGRTLDELGPATRTLAPGMESLRGVRRGDLARLVERTSVAMKAIGRQENDLVGLLHNGAITFNTLGVNHPSLRRLMADGPETMASTRTTMRRLRVTLDELDPLATDLRPGARILDESADDATETLKIARPLLADARAAFDDLQPAVGDLAAASNEAVPLMNNLEPTLDRTRNKIIPWLDDRAEPANLRNVESIGAFFSAVNSAGAEFQTPGHFIHFVPGLGEQLAAGVLPCTGFNSGIDNVPACQALGNVLANQINQQIANALTNLGIPTAPVVVARAPGQAGAQSQSEDGEEQGGDEDSDNPVDDVQDEVEETTDEVEDVVDDVTDTVDDVLGGGGD